MLSAPEPFDEVDRIKTLIDYDILDTSAERQFDELTKLASIICESSIALVSLVDVNRQWFKAKVGVDAEETPRNIAFCAHAILQDGLFEIPDAIKDERFFDNPLVTEEPSIRFYAGAPLITPTGHSLGTLCVIDKKPKVLNETQRNALLSLSHAVVSQLELRVKNQELEKMNAFRRDFISYVSHELRTPLNAVITFSNLLTKEIAPLNLPKSINTKLDHITSSGQRILHIVNSVLDLNQLEVGKIHINVESTCTQTLFSRLEAISSVIATKAKCTLHFHLLPTIPSAIELDEGKFFQIALNLIGNAIKYSADIKNVNVYVDYVDSNLIFCVKDEGIGMSEEDQKTLFTRYLRLKQDTNVEGTGLGLTISKGLVDLMSGQIFINSRLNLGTLVKVSLPAATTDPASVSKQKDNSSTLTAKTSAKILIVEDNTINQSVIESVFATLGFSIDIVSSGEACLDKVQSSKYDLIIMDIRLPGITGLEAAAALRAQLLDVPIVALTADIITNFTDYKSVGIEKVLNKPIDINALVSVLNHYLTD